jgi:hypothetical protein
MFEVNMDEYLDEEIKAVKHAFDATCKGWDQKVCIITFTYDGLFLFTEDSWK